MNQMQAIVNEKKRLRALYGEIKVIRNNVSIIEKKGC